jgi:hypothetical protein
VVTRTTPKRVGAATASGSWRRTMNTTRPPSDVFAQDCQLGSGTQRQRRLIRPGHRVPRRMPPPSSAPRA